MNLIFQEIIVMKYTHFKYCTVVGGENRKFQDSKTGGRPSRKKVTGIFGLRPRAGQGRENHTKTQENARRCTTFILSTKTTT